MGAVIGLLFIAAILGAYFAPWIVAAVRHLPNQGPVIVINIFLGWTMVGWVVALAMACRSKPQPAMAQWMPGPPGAWPAIPPSGPPAPLPPVTGRHALGDRTRREDGD